MLPPELNEMVFERTTLLTLAVLSQVCKTWQEVSERRLYSSIYLETYHGMAGALEAVQARPERAAYLGLLNVDFSFCPRSSDTAVAGAILLILRRARNLKYLRMNLRMRVDLEPLAKDIDAVLQYVPHI